MQTVLDKKMGNTVAGGGGGGAPPKQYGITHLLVKSCLHKGFSFLCVLRYKGTRAFKFIVSISYFR
jgi:hypothetical protein